MDCVIDTHALIWYLFARPELSATAKLYLERVASSEGLILISTISFVEITYLIENRRLNAYVLTRINQALQVPDSVLKPVELAYQIPLALAQIPRLTVPDMPDRIIAATALHLGLPLVTKDEKIHKLTNIKTIW